MSAVPAETRFEIQDLCETYARLLDEDRLEDWLDLFTDPCRYEILTRENLSQNLPLSLMLCDNKDMLRDRISSLRNANIFNIHTDCHVLGPVQVFDSGRGFVAGAAYSLYQSTQEGVSKLFSVGRYRFDLARHGTVLAIETALIVTDTSTVQTLLATPL